MRFRELAVFAILMMLIVPLHGTFGELDTPKLVVFIEPDAFYDTEELLYEYEVERIQELLGPHGYNFIRWRGEATVYQVDRILLIYMGHGINTTDPIVFLPTRFVYFNHYVNQFHAKELIMLNMACYGGNWLTLDHPGRIIISSVNDSYAVQYPRWVAVKHATQFYEWRADYVSPSILDLLELWQDQPIEQAFAEWRLQLSYWRPKSWAQIDNQLGNIYI